MPKSETEYDQFLYTGKNLPYMLPFLNWDRINPDAVFKHFNKGLSKLHFRQLAPENQAQIASVVLDIRQYYIRDLG